MTTRRSVDITRQSKQNRILLLTLAAITLAAILMIRVAPSIAAGGRRHAPPAPPRPHANILPDKPGPVQSARVGDTTFSAKLSRTKLVQGDNGEVFIEASISSPDLPAESTKLPTDMILILDHSGSMSAENRLPYAKRAVHDLIDRMSANDRLAVVIFDSNAEVLFPLAYLDSNSRADLHKSIDRINPGSNTRMSAGIELAEQVLRNTELREGRARKVLLLSDGEANEGISDIPGLNRIVSHLNSYQQGVVSTVGMGLGFNERLMVSLADQGGGNFAYLETLERLGEILARNLDDARQVYAAQSTIEINLGDGVTLKEANGYPIEQHGRVASIKTGQLLSGSEKRVFLTLVVPTASLGDISPAEVSFHYNRGPNEFTNGLPKGSLQLAVLEPARRNEAQASIDKGVYTGMYNDERISGALDNLWNYVKRGSYADSKDALNAYKNDLRQAEKEVGSSIASAPAQQRLAAIEQQLDNAFKGSAAEQAQKQNALGKALMYDSNLNRRKVYNSK